jgi:hypothetical protein
LTTSGAPVSCSALLRVEERRDPRFLARLHVERDDPAVECAEVDVAVPGSEAPVVGLEEQRGDQVELEV